MKTASELISFLVKDKHFSLCSVCELHKPCATTPRCSWKPAKRFVNFDDVKTAYCKEHQVISCASVDGLSEKNEKLLFVEIKGWVDFLQYQKKNVEKKIEKQVLGYDFIKKLKDSIDICNDYASNPKFCNANHLVYIIVTDIDIKEQPLQTLQGNLMALAQTSSSLEVLCNKYMLSKIISIKGIHTYYKQCKELDSFIDNGL